MAVIRALEGDWVDRAAWAMAYFGRTLYFNGPRTNPSARAFLRQPDTFAARATLEEPVKDGSDPIDVLLDRFLQSAYLQRKLSERATKRREWAYKEPTVNARLRLVFALLSPESLAAIWRRLIPDLPTCRTLRLAEITPGDDNKPRFGTPDILLKGDGLILLIEMKTRGLLVPLSRALVSCTRYPRSSGVHPSRSASCCSEDQVEIRTRPQTRAGICQRPAGLRAYLPRAPEASPIDG